MSKSTDPGVAVCTGTMATMLVTGGSSAVYGAWLRRLRMVSSTSSGSYPMPGCRSDSRLM
jgi:hypothetical protein